MIKIISVVYIMVMSVVSGNGIFDYTVPSIEGGNQALSAYSGKRLLIVTLPIQQSPSADSLLYALDTIATAHSSTHQVIAVPAFEDGFTSGQKPALQQWYRSKLGTGILITDGLYTRKTSGSQQHGLFKWLTQVSLNQIFEVDVNGPGHKFFILGNGKLHGILDAGISVGSHTVNKVLTVQPPAE